MISLTFSFDSRFPLGYNYMVINILANELTSCAFHSIFFPSWTTFLHCPVFSDSHLVRLHLVYRACFSETRKGNMPVNILNNFLVDRRDDPKVVHKIHYENVHSDPKAESP